MSTEEQRSDQQSGTRRIAASVARAVLALLCGAAVLSARSVALQSDLNQAFKPFWNAYTAEQFDAAIAGILATDPDIGELLSVLRKGRTYSADVPKGRHVSGHRNLDLIEHLYVVHVPSEYDPGKRYPVRVYLHGGVTRARATDGLWWRDDDRFARSDTIVVFPTAWRGRAWWSTSQIEALSGILNDLKHRYNIDENGIFLLGHSDGATGVYYHAFKAQTPWAGFLPFNGHPLVLANGDVDGEMHVPNLRNKPLLVINGRRDGLYPADVVAHVMRLFVAAGVSVDFRPQPEAGHDLSWWAHESPAIDLFIETTRRQPLPDRLVWETERTDRFNRSHWLVVTELGGVPGEASFEEFNTITDMPETNSGEAFPHTFSSGRIELERRGNVVAARTRGVKKFKLLLSPDQFDLSQPITVVTNGVRAFAGTVTPNRETLLRWAAVDHDRTLLFVAELDVEVKAE